MKPQVGLYISQIVPRSSVTVRARRTCTPSITGAIRSPSGVTVWLSLTGCNCAVAWTGAPRVAISPSLDPLPNLHSD